MLRNPKTQQNLRGEATTLTTELRKNEILQSGKNQDGQSVTDKPRRKKPTTQLKQKSVGYSSSL